MNAVLEFCTELHPIVALGVWIVCDARRGIDGRLDLAVRDAVLETESQPTVHRKVAVNTAVGTLD